MEKLSDAREAIDVLTIRSHLENQGAGGNWGLLILQNLPPQPHRSKCGLLCQDCC